MLILDNFLQEKSDQGEGITAEEEQLARWGHPYTVRREIEEKKRDLEKKRGEKSRKRGRLEARLPRYVCGYFWCSYSYSIPPFDDF